MTDKAVKSGYEAVIGLEVHAQLRTESKMFCGCKAEYGAPPNSRTCPVCLGLPGALPVPNEKAVEYGIKMILAVGGEVAARTGFARKNYFYSDLPKGYQITQFDMPLGVGGGIEINSRDTGAKKTIAIKRIHLEEDAGKLIHPDGEDNVSYVDLNRCGVPLLEIVSEPDIAAPAEAHEYLIKLKQVLQYLGICTGDMEKGHLRCDANVSIRPIGSNELRVRTEVKNLNSFRFVEKALAYEIQRQTDLIITGKTVKQCTMMWNEEKQSVEPMRLKEEAPDYRYFPEPDLPLIMVDDITVADIKSELPEMPDRKKSRFIDQYGLSEYDAGIISESRSKADYYEAVMERYRDAKIAANWLINEVLRVINEAKVDIEEFIVKPRKLAELLVLIDSGHISGKIAKEVFRYMVDSGRSAADIITLKGLAQITDRNELERIVEEVISEEKANVGRYLAGQKKLFDFFVGQVMKKSDGKAGPELTTEILREKLNGLEG